MLLPVGSICATSFELNLDISNSNIIEFCETQSVYLKQKYILIAFSNHILALETFLQVQITQSAKLICTLGSLNL